MKSLIVFTISILLISNLIGCSLPPKSQSSSAINQKDEIEPSSTSIPTTTKTIEPTQTKTSTPTITATSVPTMTPTATLLIGRGSEVISKVNVAKLSVLGQIGKGAINDIAWSADGSKFVLGTGVGIYIYNSDYLEQEQFIQTQTSITNIDISPDGQSVITVDNTFVINMWDLLTGEIKFTLHEVKKCCGMSSASFSPDGKMVFAFFCEQNLGNKIHIWDSSTGEEITVLYHTGLTEATCLAISANGKTVAAATSYGTINIWDIETGTKLSQPKPEYFLWWTNENIALSYDGALLAYSGNENSIRLWDISSGTLIRSFFDTAQVVSLWFSQDANTLVSLNEDYDMRFWDVDTGDELRHYEGINIGYFSPDGKSLITYCDFGTYCLYDLETWSIINELTDFNHSVSSLTLSSETNSTIFTQYSYASQSNSLNYPSEIAVYSIPDGYQVVSFRNPFLGELACSYDGQLVAAEGWYGNGSNKIFLIDFKSGNVLYELEGPTSGINTIEFSPNNEFLASGDFDNNTLLWDVKSGTLAQTLAVNAHVFDISFSKDGQKLAVGSENNVQFWDTTLGILQSTFTGFYKQIFSYAVAFSSDGTKLASGGFNGAVDVFDADYGVRLKYLEGHDGPINSLAFSPNGIMLATASDDRTIRLWDVETGDEIAIIDDLPGVVNSVTFSRDGKFLISGGDDGIIRFWGIP